MNLYCCETSFDNKEKYERHAKKFHPKDSDKIYICTINGCFEPFFINRDLIQHRYRKSHSEFDNKELLQCPLYCGFFCKSYKICREHLIQYHDIDDPLINYTDKSHQHLVYTRRDLYDHILYVDFLSRVNNTICHIDNCKRMLRPFKTVVKLKDHICNVHMYNSIPVECPDCKITYENQYKLERHIKNVHVKYTFLCKLCDSTFKDKSNLNRHIKNIHGKKSHKCGYCEFETKNLKILSGHITKYHAIHKCEQCDKDCSTASNLYAHIRNIHSPKIISCTENNCDSLFTSTNYLKAHLKDFHKLGFEPFPCKYENCDRIFTRNWSRKMHYQNLHDEGDKECQICLNNVFSLQKYHDKSMGDILMICKKCYKKSTGYPSRKEEKIVKWLVENFKFPLLSHDKRVMGNACLLYRPDVIYASPDSNLMIYVEIDEHQHLKSTGSYLCEEKRMSEIYDETPGKHVVFIRFNPDGYNPDPKKPKITCKEERRELLLHTISHVASDSYTSEIDKLPPLRVVYICYSTGNRLLTQRLNKKMVYSIEDIKNI
jgi:hypothetical protein